MALTRITGKALPTGSVIQTEQAIVTQYKNITSSSYTDTGVSGSITPRFADSKILVRFALQMGSSQANSNELKARMLRDSTVIETYERPIMAYNASSGAGDMHVNSVCIFEFLDSPATTSEVTYKMQGLTSSGRFRVNDFGTSATGSASMVTMQEITT